MSLDLLVSDEVKEARLALCEVCPHLRKNIPDHPDAKKKIGGNKCNLCGCYMPAKTKMKKYPNGAVVSCPAKKW